MPKSSKNFLKLKNQGVNIFLRTKTKHIFTQLVTQQEGLSSSMSCDKNLDHPVLLKEHVTELPWWHNG